MRDAATMDRLAALLSNVVLPNTHDVIELDVPWCTQGGLQLSVPEHRAYLTSLSESFLGWMRDAIDRVAARHAAAVTPLRPLDMPASAAVLDEPATHHVFAQRRASVCVERDGAYLMHLPLLTLYACSRLIVREEPALPCTAFISLFFQLTVCFLLDTLAMLRSRLTESLTPSSTGYCSPVVLFGPSGSGKTTVLARTALDSSGDMADETADLASLSSSATAASASTADETSAATSPHYYVVMRFLGTTPSSSTPLLLLTSLTAELAMLADTTGAASNSGPNAAAAAAGVTISHSTVAPAPLDMPTAVAAFQAALAAAVTALAPRPLLLVFDSADQLFLDRPPASALEQVLEWLPTPLPASLACLVSVLLAADTLPSLRASRSCTAFALAPWSTASARRALRGQLSQLGRRLTDAQESAALQAWSCLSPTPLALHLLARQASEWTSADDTASRLLSASAAAHVTDSSDASDVLILRFFHDLANAFGSTLVKVCNR